METMVVAIAYKVVKLLRSGSEVAYTFTHTYSPTGPTMRTTSNTAKKQ